MKDLLPRTELPLELDGQSLRVEDVVAFARGGAECALSGEAAARIEATRTLKQDLISRETPIYGVTTGFGDSAHRQISPSKTARLQQNMLRLLGAGTGRPWDGPRRRRRSSTEHPRSPRVWEPRASPGR